MSDVTVIEQCCYCKRNLSADKLIRNESRGVYYCIDTDDCRDAQGQEHEQPTSHTGRVRGSFSHPHLRFHYNQSGCGGVFAGFLVGTTVFFGSWVYAIKTYGWFLGLSLGWIPSLFLSFFAALFWPVALLVILGLILFYK